MQEYTTVLNYGFLKLSTKLLKTMKYNYSSSQFVKEAKYNSKAKTLILNFNKGPAFADCFLNKKKTGYATARIAQGFNGQVVCIRNIFKNLNLQIKQMSGYRYKTQFNQKKNQVLIKFKEKQKTKKARNS